MQRFCGASQTRDLAKLDGGRGKIPDSHRSRVGFRDDG
jgi:hypothetical protein